MAIGMRREDKHEWEARAPLTPTAVGKLVGEGIDVVVQPSPIRAFGDDEYRNAGASIAEDLSRCDVVLAVKEIPDAIMREGGAYLFFSHTIKGQAHNLPMLRRLMELGCTLIDYERIVDDKGRRLVFFGYHAGLAGMIDTLAVLGRRLTALGHATALSGLELAHQYADLSAAKDAVRAAGAKLTLPAELSPLICGFAGYGNVSRGAQEIFDLLAVEEIAPAEIGAVVRAGAQDKAFKVVFREEHLVEPNEAGAAFELQEYYDHPERYRAIFAKAAAQLSVLVNAIYWTEAYPRLITNDWLKTTDHRLLLIGDISCDLEGAVQCTVKATTPGEPAYVFDPQSGTIADGVDGPGVAMMTTDCLPCELPKESTQAFTEALLPFVADTSRADFTGTFEEAALPDPIRRATILWGGELTDHYAYMSEFL